LDGISECEKGMKAKDWGWGCVLGLISIPFAFLVGVYFQVCIKKLIQKKNVNIILSKFCTVDKEEGGGKNQLALLLLNTG
jgi:hypothetical protein